METIATQLGCKCHASPGSGLSPIIRTGARTGVTFLSIDSAVHAISCAILILLDFSLLKNGSSFVSTYKPGCQPCCCYYIRAWKWCNLSLAEPNPLSPFTR